MTSGSDIPGGPARHGTTSMNSTSKVRDQAPAEIRKGPPEAGASQRTRVWVLPSGRGSSPREELVLGWRASWYLCWLLRPHR